MDYTVLFQQTFKNFGADPILVANVFDPPYCWTEGWQCKLPAIEFNNSTVLIMHLQDRVTINNGRIQELDVIANHYGSRAKQVVAVHMHPGLEKIYPGPVQLIEFSNHNFALMNSMRDIYDTWKHIPTQTKTINWQCLNGRTALHRRRAVDVLQHWPNGVVSYADEVPLNEWAFNTYRGTTNEDNFVRLENVYGRCAFNIVTETLYNAYPGLHSEKTMFAFLAHQVPIIIGTPHLVSHIRNLGFDMFDDIINHSYDTLPNDTRVEQALLLNRDAILSSCNTAHLITRLAANRELALNVLPNWYRTNFETRAREIVEQLVLR